MNRSCFCSQQSPLAPANETPNADELFREEFSADLATAEHWTCATMTTLVRRYLKTAIAFLVVGLVLGGWMMVRRELWTDFPSSYVVSAHTHAIVVGFVMMMILGVALWMFPRPAKEDARYSQTRASIAYWLVTLGTAGRVAGELMRSPSSALPLRLAIVTAGFLQIAGLLLYFFTMWTRIRAVGSAVREGKGERF